MRWGGVYIGDKVTLSYGVTILTQGLKTTNYKENASKVFRDHISKSVKIGKGSWLCAKVIVCPGSTIAENCIVAAGSVVIGNLSEANCLYGGIPAVKIKNI